MAIKILVVAPAWIGDAVMAGSLFRALKQRHGEALILDVLANPWVRDVLTRMPEVNQVIINPFKHGELALWRRIKFGRKLKRTGYHQAFILANSLKSAIIPFFAGIPKRTGYIGELRYYFINDIYRLDKSRLPRLIDRFSALANHGSLAKMVMLPALTVDLTHQLRLKEQLGLNAQLPLVIFCPAAEYGPAKRWLPEHFAALGNMLLARNYQVAILGSKKDSSISEQIITHIPNSADWIKKSRLFDLCGVTSLLDSIDLLALAQHVVTNDSGLMHIACAVNTHVIALYGSSSPGFTPPLSEKAIVIQHKLDCQPCFARTCRYGHYNCLKFIMPEQVLAHVVESRSSFI